MLATLFGASPLSQQNLTNWRRGGYQHWLHQQEHRHLAREAVQEVKDLAGDPNVAVLADQLSTFLVAQLAVSARTVRGEVTDPKEQWERLRAMLRTVGQVRREDYLTGRLALDRERQAFVVKKKQRDGGSPETGQLGRQGQTM